MFNSSAISRYKRPSCRSNRAFSLVDLSYRFKYFGSLLTHFTAFFLHSVYSLALIRRGYLSRNSIICLTTFLEKKVNWKTILPLPLAPYGLWRTYILPHCMKSATCCKTSLLEFVITTKQLVWLNFGYFLKNRVPSPSIRPTTYQGFRFYTANIRDNLGYKSLLSRGNSQKAVSVK